MNELRFQKRDLGHPRWLWQLHNHAVTALDHIYAFHSEVLGGCEKACIIRVDDTETCHSGSSEMDRVGSAQEHLRGQIPIDVTDSRENFPILREPLNAPALMCVSTWPTRALYAAGLIASSRSLRWKAAIISASPRDAQAM